VPVFTYENYTDVSSIPSHLVDEIKDALEKNMKDIDICLTHDIMLQDAFLPHNLAVRKISLPIKWFHWIHSQPNNVKISNLPMGHKLVFLNYTDRLQVAERFSTWMDDVKVVYNSVEPHTFVGDKITEECSKILEGKDIKIPYAFCTTRMGAKGVNKLLKLAGRIKANGKSVGVCLMNSNANAEKEKKAIANMSEFAIKCGLTSDDFVFTSTLNRAYECGVPHHVVRDIFSLSNTFIFPTTSECCSLILLEAISAGCKLVLNDDIPSMKEFGGFQALYMKFGSIFRSTSYSNESSYYNDWSKIIIRHMKEPVEDRAKLFSEKAIWEQMKCVIS
jgi:glycosyltransferase involved in cell wall biosynthesis